MARQLPALKTNWAVMTLKANGKGVLRKTFFERGHICEDRRSNSDHWCDGENIPYGKELALVEVIERKRRKPSEKDHSS